MLDKGLILCLYVWLITGFLIIWKEDNFIQQNQQDIIKMYSFNVSKRIALVYPIESEWNLNSNMTLAFLNWKCVKVIRVFNVKSSNVEFRSPDIPDQEVYTHPAKTTKNKNNFAWF